MIEVQQISRQSVVEAGASGMTDSMLNPSPSFLCHAQAPHTGFPYILHTPLSLPIFSRQDATQFRADQILVRRSAVAAPQLDSIRAPAPRKGRGGRTPIPLSRPLLSSSLASGLIRSHLYSRGVSCNLGPPLPLPLLASKLQPLHTPPRRALLLFGIEFHGVDG